MLGAMGDGAPKIGRAAHAPSSRPRRRARGARERFAFATDDRERQEALRLASAATMRVNTMRRASAHRASRDEPRMRRRARAEDAAHAREGGKKQDPLPRRLPSLTRRNAACGPELYERQSTASRTRSPRRPASRWCRRPSRDARRPRRNPRLRSAPTPRRGHAATGRRARPRARRRARRTPISPETAHSKSPPTARSPDVEHAAAVRVQRIQRGRAARDRVKALSDARRVAAKEKEREAAVRAGAVPTARPERAGRDRAREREQKMRVGVARVARGARGGFVAPFRLAFSSRGAVGSETRSRSPSSRDEGEDVFAPETETARRKDEATTATKTPTKTPTAAPAVGRAAAARRLKLRLEAEMAAARESALADARRESRNGG